MTDAPGRPQDLPGDPPGDLRAQNTRPPWPSLRSVLPFGRPSRSTRPSHWRYRDIRPQMLRAGDPTPIEEPGRRVPVAGRSGLGL